MTRPHLLAPIMMLATLSLVSACDDSAQNEQSTVAPAFESATTDSPSDPFTAAELARSKRDWPTAIKLYQTAYEQGSPLAAHWLGVAHVDGLGTPVDKLKAMRYFQFAADHNLTGSMTYLAEFYFKAEVVGRDCNTSERLIRQANNGDLAGNWEQILKACRILEGKQSETPTIETESP